MGKGGRGKGGGAGGAAGGVGIGDSGPGGRGPGRLGGNDAEHEREQWFIAAFEGEVVRNAQTGAYTIIHKWGGRTMIAMPKIEGLARIDLVEKGLSIRFNNEKGSPAVRDNPMLLADWMLRHWHFPNGSSKNSSTSRRRPRHASIPRPSPSSATCRRCVRTSRRISPRLRKK
jgi:hypothetical protein